MSAVVTDLWIMTVFRTRGNGNQAVPEHVRRQQPLPDSLRWLIIVQRLWSGMSLTRRLFLLPVLLEENLDGDA